MTHRTRREFLEDLVIATSALAIGSSGMATLPAQEKQSTSPQRTSSCRGFGSSQPGTGSLGCLCQAGGFRGGDRRGCG